MPETPVEFDSDFASPSEWAVMYRACSLQVVPAKLPIKGGEWKMPALAKWKEWRRTFVPWAVFNSWFGENGEFRSHDNMGVICGEVSDRVVMIDLDTYKSGAAMNWWLGVLAEHNNGMEPETWEQITGGGGRQLFFRYPAGWRAVNASTDLNVDIRGNGGFAVLPPSRHTSGKHYDWVAGRAPYDIGIATAEPWLLKEIDRLILEHGGISHAGVDHGEGDAPEFSAFARRTNRREQYMRDMIWAAMTGYRLQSAIPVGAVELEATFADYERNCGPKTVLEGESNAEGLEREGRGRTLFEGKWNYASAQWETEVAAAAKQRDGRERQPNPGPLTSPPIEWLDMSNWDNIPVPIRKWAILDRVPLNQVGLFSGEGGTGKSIIELMKDVAHVTGRDWLGSLPEQGGAFYLGAEDESEEIHIRLAAIAKHYGTTFKELTRLGLKVLPLLGKDSMLCVQAGRGNHIETTALYRQLYEAAGDLRPKNISIDTLSRAFGGDEINRVQVYAFAMHMQAIAKVAQGSVTILSHPSLSGMASGSGISGSTAWHGAFRFRQYLKGVKDEGDDPDPADDDLRELEFKKNQYGPRGRPIVLRYVDGLFLPVNGATDPERVAREARAEGCFVNLLRKFRERGDDVSHKLKSHYYAPRLFVDELVAKEHKFRLSELEDAMRRLMDAGRVLVEIHSKNSRPQTRLVLSPGS